MSNFLSTGRRAAGVVLVALLALPASPGLAPPQFNPAAPPSPPPVMDQLDHSHIADEPTYLSRELQLRQQKRLRAEHQKQVFSDAARLVELATALEQQVQKGDAVTPDAMKDVDEIGKLAKRLTDRIKTQ